MLFFTLQRLLRALVFSFLHVQVRGLERIEARGPLLLVGNHPTIVDGLVLALLAPRKVRFVAAEELLAVPGLGALLRWLGAIPAGASAVEAAAAALRRGDLVAIFPEGRTSNGRAVLPFRSGAARIAALSGATVVPFALDGTQNVYPHGACWARPARVELALGEPMCGPDSEDLHFEVERLWRECRSVGSNPWPLRQRAAAALAALVVLPFSLVATLLHLTSSARRLTQRLQEDAR